MKVPPVPNFAEIHPVGTALMHADRRTDMTGQINACRVYADAPKTLRFVTTKELHYRTLFLVPLINVILSDKEHGMLTKVCPH
jgi:hypothetical protein